MQATRAIELYQEIVPAIVRLGFAPIKRKLHEISKTENQGQRTGARNQAARQLVPRDLAELALTGHVVAGTQNQAISALVSGMTKSLDASLGSSSRFAKNRRCTYRSC